MDFGNIFSPFTAESKGFFGDINPAVKLMAVAGATALSVTVSDVQLLITMGLLFLVLLILSGALRASLPFLSIIVFFWILSAILACLTGGGIGYAMGLSQFFARFFIIAGAGLFFAFTTSPLQLASALESLRIPGEVIFTLTVALRYIPVLALETAAIWDSLKLRVNLSGFRMLLKPSIIYRGLIVPLIIRAVKISDEVAVAAESRGFDPGKRQNTPLQFKGRDLAFITLLAFFLSSIKLIEIIK